MSSRTMTFVRRPWMSSSLVPVGVPGLRGVGVGGLSVLTSWDNLLVHLCLERVWKSRRIARTCLIGPSWSFRHSALEMQVGIDGAIAWVPGPELEMRCRVVGMGSSL